MKRWQRNTLTGLAAWTVFWVAVAWAISRDAKRQYQPHSVR